MPKVENQVPITECVLKCIVPSFDRADKVMTFLIAKIVLAVWTSIIALTWVAIVLP